MQTPTRREFLKTTGLTDSTDHFPTLLELAGLSVPNQSQGQSLVPFLTGRRDPSQARQFTFSERVRPNPQGRRRVLPNTKGAFMIRGQGWKYIRYENAEVFLYHLQEDPGEIKNLAREEKHKSRRNELAAEMNKWLQRTGWPGPPTG